MYTHCTQTYTHSTTTKIFDNVCLCVCINLTSHHFSWAQWMHTQKFKSIVFIARNTAFIEFPFETLFKYAACCLKHVFFHFCAGAYLCGYVCMFCVGSFRFAKKVVFLIHRYWFVHNSHCARMSKSKSNEMCIKLGKIHRFQIRMVWLFAYIFPYFIAFRNGEWERKKVRGREIWTSREELKWNKIYWWM